MALSPAHPPESDGPNSPLSPSTQLRVAPSLRIYTRSDGECDLEVPRGKIRAGPLTLSVLGVFASTRPLSEATAILSKQLSGQRAALELLSTIVQLFEQGALIAPAAELSANAKQEGFGSAPIHVAMLSDAVRTETFLRAIRATVRPGQVVLDIGTGTGILAIAAAKAGAKKVYAIDSACAELARKMVAENGVGDRVEVLSGWSRHLKLPEFADLVISEILDDDPLRENVLETLSDARTRLLKPDARTIPQSLTVFGALVEVPADELKRYTFTKELINQWANRYSLSFEPLIHGLTQNLSANISRQKTKGWRRLSQAHPLAEIDLQGHRKSRVQCSQHLKAIREGQCHGLLTYFEVKLTETLRISTDPLDPGGASHWLNPTLLLAHPRKVNVGDQVRAGYRYPLSPAFSLTWE